jgi:hypothetical protein
VVASTIGPARPRKHLARSATASPMADRSLLPEATLANQRLRPSRFSTASPTATRTRKTSRSQTSSIVGSYIP